MAQDTNNVQLTQEITQEKDTVTQDEKQPDVSVMTQNTNDRNATQEVVQENGKIITQKEELPDASAMTHNTNDINATQEVAQENDKIITPNEEQPDVSAMTQNINDIKSTQAIIQENGEIVSQNENQPDVSAITQNANDIESTQEITQDNKSIPQNEINYAEQSENDLQLSNHQSQADINTSATPNIDDTAAGNEQNLQTPNQDLTELANQDNKQTTIVDSDSQIANDDHAVQQNRSDTMVNSITGTSPTNPDDLVHTNNDSIQDETKMDDTEISTSIANDTNQTASLLETSTLTSNTEVADDQQNVDTEVEQPSAGLQAEVSQENIINEQVIVAEIPESISTNIEVTDVEETPEHALADSQTNVTGRSEVTVDDVKSNVTSANDNDVEVDRESEHSDAQQNVGKSDAKENFEPSTVADCGNTQVDAIGDNVASHQNTTESVEEVKDEKVDSTTNPAINKEVKDQIINDVVDISVIQV